MAGAFSWDLFRDLPVIGILRGFSAAEVEATARAAARGGLRNLTVETLPDYKRAGADGFGVGNPLFDRARIAAGDWRWVDEQARRFAGAFRGCSSG
ncbi:MAG: hypothetical protein HY721_05780 [Planctomycetes bacterium]|nr:hypothetical protein [Planctomycetota bacterium]